MKKNFIQKIKDDMEEGELMKLKAKAAIEEEEQAEKRKRQKAM